jgi:putative transposase
MREQRTVVFVDGSGVYLLPAILRTWAKKGQTPVLRTEFSRSKVNLLGAISSHGQIICQVQQHSFKSADVIAFLRHLLAVLPGKLLIVWDNATTHKSRLLKAFLQQIEVADRLAVLYLPPYAPHLNPIELVWRYLKYVLLKSICCFSIDELMAEVQRAIRKLKRLPHIIRNFIRHVGYVNL